MKLNAAKVSFGRHESFPLRFGWITKGLDALADDPNVFAAEDATVTLGVGKNMVAAMRPENRVAQAALVRFVRMRG